MFLQKINSIGGDCNWHQNKIEILFILSSTRYIMLANNENCLMAIHRGLEIIVYYLNKLLYAIFLKSYHEKNSFCIFFYHILKRMI